VSGWSYVELVEAHFVLDDIAEQRRKMKEEAKRRRGRHG